MAEVDRNRLFTLMFGFLFSQVQGIKQVFIAGYVIVYNFLVAINCNVNITILHIRRTIRIEVHICFRPEFGITVCPCVVGSRHIVIHILQFLCKGVHMEVINTICRGSLTSCTGSFSCYCTQADTFTSVHFCRFVIGTCRYQCHGR